MVILDGSQLEFHLPDVHPEACCAISFQRTLRVPDDAQQYPLPATLGQFPLYHVEDYIEKLPSLWQQHGGIFLPMYQGEALWLKLTGDYPCAIKVAAGKINAITGEPWSNELQGAPQDYAVLPFQRWIDGFCVGPNQLRQFVAMPLGNSCTAEEQLTGLADVGGVQLCVYPLKAEVYEQRRNRLHNAPQPEVYYRIITDSEMGLAPGGLLHEALHEDPLGVDCWDTTNPARCFVHLINSCHFQAVTGNAPPTPPPTAKQYAAANLPWFASYAADRKALGGAIRLANMKSIGRQLLRLGKQQLFAEQTPAPRPVLEASRGSREPGVARQ